MRKILLIIIVLSLISGCGDDAPVSKELAECIASKSTLYVTSGCSSCLKQEKMFGDNLRYLNMIDCAFEAEECNDADIIKVPTWDIDGMNYVGVKDIEELKELTGC